jgi:hypothetical protein
MANLYHRDAHLRLHRKGQVRRQRRRSAGSKAYRRQQGRAQGGKREVALATYTQRASKAGGKRSLLIQRKEAVEAVAPALARGWLRQGLGRSTGINVDRASSECEFTTVRLAPTFALVIRFTQRLRRIHKTRVFCLFLDNLFLNLIVS